MNRARWYSSSTALVNGEIYIQGGNGGGDFPEVRDGAGNFRLLTGANYVELRGDLSAQFPCAGRPDLRLRHEWQHVLRFDRRYRLTGRARGNSTPRTPAGPRAPPCSGPGKILQMGGNSAGAVVIDINGPTPVVTTQPTMSSQRQWVSATVMADGRVVATGGTQTDNQLVGINNTAEVWNPATGQWTVGPSGSRARMYHSGALLLPDATVMVSRRRCARTAQQPARRNLSAVVSVHVERRARAAAGDHFRARQHRQRTALHRERGHGRASAA